MIDQTDAHLLIDRQPILPGASSATPLAVRVVDVRLSWASAFDIAFKFSVVFAILQAVGLVLLYLLLR
jgi:hypothetical protein